MFLRITKIMNTVITTVAFNVSNYLLYKSPSGAHFTMKLSTLVTCDIVYDNYLFTTYKYCNFIMILVKRNYTFLTKTFTYLLDLLKTVNDSVFLRNVESNCKRFKISRN